MKIEDFVGANTLEPKIIRDMGFQYCVELNSFMYIFKLQGLIENIKI